MMRPLFMAVMAMLVMSQVACGGSNFSGSNGNPEKSSGTRGGGDPDAVEFLLLGDKLATWLVTEGASPDIDMAFEFKDKVTELSVAMDDENNPSIRFTDNPVQGDSGTDKVAIFSKDPLRITVNRQKWRALDMQEKLTTVALEIYGLIG